MAHNWKHFARVFYHRAKIYSQLGQQEIDRLEKLIVEASVMRKCSVCDKYFATQKFNYRYHTITLCDPCSDNNENKLDAICEELPCAKSARDVNEIIEYRHSQ